MNHGEILLPPPDAIAVRAGCELAYAAKDSALLYLLIRPRTERTQIMFDERLEGCNSAEEIVDAHGNALLKIMLEPGRHVFRHDALVFITGDDAAPAAQLPPERLPADVVRYLLPSRYCESDRVYRFAHQLFDRYPPGIERVRAVCDWTHRHLEYRHGSGNSLLSACDVLVRGYGVCRDFAHLMIALCRALDIPARYAAGHMPLTMGAVARGDVGVDFHAWCEVYLDSRWLACDPRYNDIQSERVVIARGMDAVDAAFATFYGEVAPIRCKVWAYEVDHRLGWPDEQPSACAQ